MSKPEQQPPTSTYGASQVELHAEMPLRRTARSTAETKPGEVGEIAIRGHSVMKGYWHRPDATADVLDAEGWFRTGDVGRVDADGFYLTRPGAMEVLEVPIDLGKVTVDSYVVAGIADHFTPWENCYRTTQLFGGTTRFVLSSSGHIAALVNPPGNPKASYHTNQDPTPDPHAWLKSAQTHQGTWWDDIDDWLDARCGNGSPAPKDLGSIRYPVLTDAPGTYVLDK